MKVLNVFIYYSSTFYNENGSGLASAAYDIESDCSFNWLSFSEFSISSLNSYSTSFFN